MVRGTTPSIVFSVNESFNLATIKELWLTLKNNVHERTFTKSEVTIHQQRHTITVTLTQEETLAFKVLDDCEAQIRFLDLDDKAYATNIVKIRVDRILKEGVIE